MRSLRHPISKKTASVCPLHGREEISREASWSAVAPHRFLIIRDFVGHTGKSQEWSEQMTEAIDQIQKLFESQQGVYIDIEVSCQKCDEVTSPDMGGEISIFPLTTHLDWKTHTSWYIDTDAGKSGVARVFNLDDITGILQALAVSFGLALQNITY